MFFPAHIYTQLVVLLVYFFVLMVSERIPILFHKLDLFLKFCRFPKVIAIKECNPFALCIPQCGVSGNCSSAICAILINTNPIIIFLELQYYIHCIISRTVINDDEFPVLISLRLYTFYALTYKASAFIGTNKIIRKSEFTEEKKTELVKIINEWLHRKNIGALHAEPQYKGMKLCVIAEEVLPCDPGTTTLTDYKIWCFNGKAYYVWICNDRSAGGNSAHVMTYDLDWNAHPEFSVFNSDYLRGEIMPKPQNFEEMIQVAEKLSQGFPELRVDLYNVQGKIYFGKLTFTSQGGFMDFYTPEFNLELGSKFDIKDFPVKKK